MAERIRFFGLSDNKLFYDERKKRFVFLEDAPAIAEKAYKNAHFKEVITIIIKHSDFSKDQISLDKNKLTSKTNLSMDNN